jgi:hypothetical protein
MGGNPSNTGLVGYACLQSEHSFDLYLTRVHLQVRPDLACRDIHLTVSSSRVALR